MSNYKIYGLTVKGDNKIRYVGYTKRTLERRLYHHLFDAKQGLTYKKCQWIKKYDYNIGIILLEDNLTYEEALIKETFYIKKFKTYTEGMNMSYGGEENPMNNPEVREKHSKKMKTIRHKFGRFGEDNWMTTDEGKKWFKENNPMNNPEAREKHKEIMKKRRIVVDPIKLKKEYIDNNKTLKECAEIFNVSYYSIIKNLKVNNIKKYNYKNE